MYQRNEQGALVLQGSVKTLVITEQMLKEYDDEYGPFMGVLKVLTQYFPEVIQKNDFALNEQRLRSIARELVIHTSAQFSDPLYITRVWFMAVETVLNTGNIYFRLRFPFIEGNED